MLINGKQVVGNEFAYDDCHKIYIIEDENDRKSALECGYTLYPIEQLLSKYNHSCELRFINNWKLTIRYVEQFEKLEIEF